MKAIILSAGRGERMRPLTDTTPKPLLKIDEYSLIEHHLFALAKAGFKEIVVNVAYLPQLFVETLGDGSRYGVTIHYSFEPENGGLETGGGILQALPLLGNEPFLAISADLWTNFPFQTLPQNIPNHAHLVLVDNPFHHPHGDFCLQQGKVTLEGNNKLNFAGIAVYNPKLFANCQPGRFSVVPLIIEAIKQKQVSGEYFRGIWQNIGTLEQLNSLRNIIVLEK